MIPTGITGTGFKNVAPVPCAHIAAFYHRQWEGHKCLAFQLLRRGYHQAAKGLVEVDCNNLWEYT